MAFRCSRWWVVGLALGYLFFIPLLIAEKIFNIATLNSVKSSELSVELFRDGWLEWYRALAPARWFMDGPCQRLPMLTVMIFLPAACLLIASYVGALRAIYREPGAWSLARLLRCAVLVAIPLLFVL